MLDREKVIKELIVRIQSDSEEWNTIELSVEQAKEILAVLKEQETVKQKMWNALYVEEDELEKKYAGTNENDNWFLIYRLWLQRGFEIALHVVVEQEGR